VLDMSSVGHSTYHLLIVPIRSRVIGVGPEVVILTVDIGRVGRIQRYPWADGPVNAVAKCRDLQVPSVNNMPWSI